MAVIVDLDVMLARRKMSVGDFANAIGITPANVAVLSGSGTQLARAGRAASIRWVETAKRTSANMRGRTPGGSAIGKHRLTDD